MDHSYRDVEHLLGAPQPLLDKDAQQAWEQELLALLDLKPEDVLDQKAFDTLEKQHVLAVGSTYVSLGAVVFNMMNAFFNATFSLFTLSTCAVTLMGLAFSVHFLSKVASKRGMTRKNPDRKHRLINVFARTQNHMLQKKIAEFLPYYESHFLPVSFWDRMHVLMNKAPYTGGVMEPMMDSAWRAFEQYVLAQQGQSVNVDTSSMDEPMVFSKEFQQDTHVLHSTRE